MDRMSKPKVLIADDSVTIQKVFELAFEDEGVELFITGDGVDALEIARNENLHLVIADCNMPRLDGFELCHAIKTDSAISHLPVYLLASSLDEFDDKKADDVGADGKFEKPFRSEEMVSNVMAAIAAIKPPEPDIEDEENDTFDEVDDSFDTLLDEVDDTAPDAESEELASPGERQLSITDNEDFSAEDRMLEAIEKEAEENRGELFAVDQSESSVSDEIEEPAPHVSEKDMENIVDETVRETINRLVTSDAVEQAIAAAVKEAVDGMQKEIIRVAEENIQKTLDEMKPEIMAVAKRITTSITLSVAEEMVKKTIDQIKEDKGNI